MARFLKTLLLFVVIAAVLYALIVGLGLTRSFKRAKVLVKTQVINDFEYVRDDFDWATGGYVKIEPSEENPTKGKLCAKVTFFPASQFYPTPAPGAMPSNSSQVFYSPEGKAAWRPQMTIDTTSVTKLEVYEWQEYLQFKMDVFNPEEYPLTYHLQIADAQSFTFETSGDLMAKKVTNIEVPLEGLIERRLDLTSIRSLRFWVEPMDLSRPAVVYLDNLRLEGELLANAKKRK